MGTGCPCCREAAGSDDALYVDSIKFVDGPIECSNGMICVLEGVSDAEDDILIVSRLVDGTVGRIERRSGRRA